MKLDEALNGGHEKFTVKEILVGHIKEDRKFQKDVRDRFEKGAGKIESNRTAVKYLYVLIVFLAGAVGFLFKHIFS